jgi:nucleoside-diphosphate-sugar epimerase
VDRVVHCSSFGAIGINPDGPSDEAWSLHPFEEAADYEISKAFSEFEVYKQIINGLDVVIVNPSTIVGPWDFRPSLLGNTIVEFGKGKMKAYIDGAYDFVAVKDVVAGLFAAMERGKTGERYILTNENLTILQTLEWLEELTGKKRPQIKVPIYVMQNVAIIKDWLERNFFPNATPRFNYHSIRMLQSGKYGDNSRARNELGIEFTPVKEAYREAVHWFRENNYF